MFAPWLESPRATIVPGSDPDSSHRNREFHRLHRFLLGWTAILEDELLPAACARAEEPHLRAALSEARDVPHVDRVGEDLQRRGARGIQGPVVARRAIGPEHDEDALAALDFNRLPRIALQQRRRGQLHDAMQGMGNVRQDLALVPVEQTQLVVAHAQEILPLTDAAEVELQHCGVPVALGPPRYSPAVRRSDAAAAVARAQVSLGELVARWSSGRSLGV